MKAQHERVRRVVSKQLVADRILDQLERVRSNSK